MTVRTRYQITAENKTDRAFRAVRSNVSGLESAFKGLAVAVAGAFSVRAVFDATAKQEAAMAQLRQAILSTKGAAGVTAQEMAKLATNLQKVTTFGDEAIIAMQAQLLTFTQLGRDVLPRATEAILDLSARMGTDLRSAALQVGKALNDPIKGVSALAEAGIQFTDAQKLVIEDLVETGRVADAQRVILAELELQFGGSARAARETFGGALEALHNALGDLLEVDGGLPEARMEIEKLTAIVSDPQTQKAFDDLFSGIIWSAGKLAESLAFVTGEITMLSRAWDAISRGELGFFEAAMMKSDELKVKLEEIGAARLDAFGGAGSDLDQFFRRPSVPQVAPPPAALPSPRITPSRTARGSSVETARKEIELYRYEAQGLAKDFRSAEDASLRALEEYGGTAAARFEWWEAQQSQLLDDMDETGNLMTEFGQQAARNMQDAFGQYFFDAMRGEFGDLEQTFVDMINRMVAELLASQLLDFLVGDFAKSGNLGGVVGDLVSNFAGSLPGFATGGSFTVGGAGGTDSKLVAFMATPGERVDISPPGAGRGVIVNMTVNTPDVGAFRRTQHQITSDLQRNLGRARRIQ